MSPRGKLSRQLQMPITYPRHSLLARSDDAEQTSLLAVTEQRLAKLPKLAAHFGISTDRKTWPLLLAMALAIKHYKGFQIGSQANKPANRPKSFDEQQIFNLLVRIQSIQMERPGTSDLDGCKIVAGEDNPALKRRDQKTALERRAKNLTRYLAPARATPAGKALAKLVEAVEQSPEK